MHQPMKIYMCGFYLMPTVKSVDNEQEKYDNYEQHIEECISVRLSQNES